jgi:hypothetical protein
MFTTAIEMQLDSLGRPEHMGVIVTLPLLANPFSPVIVSIVVPDCPGAEILMVVGFATTVNVGAGFTVTVSVTLCP